MTVTEQFRPVTLDDVVGQKAVTDELRVALEAARMRGDMPGHMLMMGPAGTGKTTLAMIVARATGADMINILGPAIRSYGRDLLPELVTVQGTQRRTVVFIDEIHRLPRPIQESLFVLMEDGVLADEVQRLPMPPMTFIGATTDPTRLLTPMLDRFPRKLKLVPYSPDELSTIVVTAAGKLGDVMDWGAALAIGNRAEGVPRVALNMMLAARDYAYAAGHKREKVTIGLAAVQQALASPAYDWRVTGRNASSR